MVNLSYEIVRRNQLVRQSNRWEDVLEHEDVVVPGRVLSFRVIGANSPVNIQLDTTDTLVFINRTALGIGSPSSMARTYVIVGKKSNNGRTATHMVDPEGNVSYLVESNVASIHDNYNNNTIASR